MCVGWLAAQAGAYLTRAPAASAACMCVGWLAARAGMDLEGTLDGKGARDATTRHLNALGGDLE